MDLAKLTEFQDRLKQAQAQARKLRCEAFVRYTPVVAGEFLQPITLDTYNALVAFENPFVVGGDLTFEALFVFIWVHHSMFGQFAEAERRKVMRRVMRTLSPRNPVLNQFARIVSSFPKMRWLARFIEPTAEELVHAAIDEVRRLVSEALAEFPTPRRRETGNDGAPTDIVPFALQAQILNLLRRDLGVSYSEARAMPLKELVQLLRECMWTASHGKVELMSPDEEDVWCDYLKAATDEIPKSP